METIGIREFRQNLAGYLESSDPLAITRHGETVAYFLPVARKRTEQEKSALHQAAAKVHETLAAKGITEDQIVEGFKKLRKKARR